MHRYILNLWKKVGIDFFWGDYLDSRFYLAKIISKWHDKIVIDVGCGSGVLLHCTNGELKVGLDISLESLKAAKKLKDSKMELIQQIQDLLH